MEVPVIASIAIAYIVLFILAIIQWMRADSAERREKYYREICDTQSETITFQKQVMDELLEKVEHLTGSKKVK